MVRPRTATVKRPYAALTRLIRSVIERLERFRRLRQAAYKPQAPSVGYPLARWFARPVALPASWLLARIGVSPNTVTLVAGLCGLAAAGLLGYGAGVAYLPGVALLWAWYLLDHVDGQLARLTGQASLTGAYLDFLMHFVVHVALWWALAASTYAVFLPVGALPAGAAAAALFLGGLLAEAHSAAVAKAIVQAHYHRGARPPGTGPIAAGSGQRAERLARWLIRTTEVPNLLLQMGVLAVCKIFSPLLFTLAYTLWLLVLVAVVPTTRVARLIRWSGGGRVEQEYAHGGEGGRP